MKNFYNDEETKYTKIINDLKALPKINSPENFEYNLMTKIQNKNFGDSKIPKYNFNLVRFFAPSAAVISIIILFMILYPTKDEIQNQLNILENTSTSQTLTQKPITENKIVEKTNIKTENKKVNKSNSVNSAPIKQSANSKLQDLFVNSRSVSVDDYLSGAPVNNRTIQRGNVVKSGDEPIVDGFLVEKQTDKQTIEKYRAALDSLRKSQLKADSIKKVQK